MSEEETRLGDIEEFTSLEWVYPYAISLAKHLESEYNTMMMQT